MKTQIIFKSLVFSAVFGAALIPKLSSGRVYAQESISDNEETADSTVKDEALSSGFLAEDEYNKQIDSAEYPENSDNMELDEEEQEGYTSETDASLLNEEDFAEAKESVTGGVGAQNNNEGKTEAVANEEKDIKDDKEEAPKEKYTGWKNENSYWYYYSSDKKYTGWNYMTAAEGEKIPHWSYFGRDGRLLTGWAELGQGTSNPDGNAARHWSYFGDNGWLRTGWVELGQGTSNPDGNAPKHWSYFDTKGWLKTGWTELGQGTSNPDGNAARHWSYFGSNGWLRTGWTELGKGTNNPDGDAARHWSYFGDNGWLRTGWTELGKGTSNPDGDAARHWSYFGSKGWLTVSSDIRENKKLHTFDSRGWLAETKTPVIRVINQRTSVFGNSGCGGAAALMALQATGYQLGVNYSSFWSTVPKAINGDFRTGYVSGVGITNPALQTG